MELIATLWDFLVHLDKHLAAFLAQYGTWVYVLLFMIVFCETGFIVTPFLPGDSLLFVVGALAATGGLSIELVIVLLVAAALLGDNTNYWAGRWLGPRVFRWEDSIFFNRKHLDRTHAFYEKHGGKTIVIARFMPFVRTFAPFVAGVARMPYSRYILFCIGGALLWVVSLTMLGYFFGNLPIVKKNLSVVIVGIIALSLTPMLYEFVKARRAQSDAHPKLPAD
jgi:membrane-associated protein